MQQRVLRYPITHLSEQQLRTLLFAEQSLSRERYFDHITFLPVPEIVTVEVPNPVRFQPPHPTRGKRRRSTR